MRRPVEERVPVVGEVAQEFLKEFSRSRTYSACIVDRARIFVMSMEDKLNQDIGKELGMHYNSVALWRQRFVEAGPRLQAIEMDHLEDLKKELFLLLSDNPRKGAPRTFTDELRTEIVTIACQFPRDYGFEAGKWSLSLIIEAGKTIGLVETISPSSVNRILNEVDVRPHKKVYWLNSKDKYENKEEYDRKVEIFNGIYRWAEELRDSGNTEGIHIISVDEMTGIQALGRPFADKPTRPGQVRKVEFEYIRNGTTSLIAGMDVIGGLILPPYLGPTRTEYDFTQAVESWIAQDPDGQYVFMVDNLNTHKSESLVLAVAKHEGIDRVLLGEKGRFGILKSMETREAFLSDESRRIRFVYTPKHCSWLNQIEIWFGKLNQKLLSVMCYDSVQELEDSIRKYIEQYNELFAHPYIRNTNKQAA